MFKTATTTEWYLLDALNLIYRAHFAMMRTNLATGTHGLGHGTTFVFLRRVIRLILDYAKRDAPIVIVFDARHLVDGTDARKEEFPEYKAGRYVGVSQV